MGSQKLNTFDFVVSNAVTIEISNSLVNNYTEIGAYSQRQHPYFNAYPFNTPRNMGKNDLWIASTAALLGLELVTTDGDFDHLHHLFLDLRRLDPAALEAFF